jgi:hypothetical protein
MVTHYHLSSAHDTTYSVLPHYLPLLVSLLDVLPELMPVTLGREQNGINESEDHIALVTVFSDTKPLLMSVRLI